MSPRRLIKPNRPVEPKDNWSLFRYFGQEGKVDGKFNEANGIVACPKGDIIVTNLDITNNTSKLYYFSKDGIYLSTMHPSGSTSSDEIIHPWDVAMTTKGQLVLSDQSKFIKLYDMNANMLSNFSVLSPDEDPLTEVTTSGVAVTPLDDIIVGDSSRSVVTIHSKDGNWVPRKIHVPIRPVYVACNNRRHIFISDWLEKKVIAMSFQGDILFQINNFKVDGRTSVPKGLTCDPEGNVYIAVVIYNERTGKVVAGTGHIHQYDNDGVFVGCILKGLYVPRGITISNQGAIYVANQTSIVIISRQSVRPLRRRCTVSVMSTQMM